MTADTKNKYLSNQKIIICKNRFYEKITNYVFIPDNKILGNWESFAWFRNYDELVVDLENDMIICREENNYDESTLEEL